MTKQRSHGTACAQNLGAPQAHKDPIVRLAWRQASRTSKRQLLLKVVPMVSHAETGDRSALSEALQAVLVPRRICGAPRAPNRGRTDNLFPHKAILVYVGSKGMMVIAWLR